MLLLSVLALIGVHHEPLRLFIEIHPQMVAKVTSAVVMLVALVGLLLEINGRGRAAVVVLMLAIFLFMVFWPADAYP